MVRIPGWCRESKTVLADLLGWSSRFICVRAVVVTGWRARVGGSTWPTRRQKSPRVCDQWDGPRRIGIIRGVGVTRRRGWRVWMGLIRPCLAKGKGSKQQQQTNEEYGCEAVTSRIG